MGAFSHTPSQILPSRPGDRDDHDALYAHCGSRETRGAIGSAAWLVFSVVWACCVPN